MAPHFSLEAASARLATITAAMHRVMQLRAQLKTINDSLREMGHEITDSDFVVDALGVPPIAVHARARFKGLFEALHDEIAAIQAEGCTIAHIEEGFVHFPIARDEPPVVFCWRYGEKALAHWHHAAESCERREQLETLPAQES